MLSKLFEELFLKRQKRQINELNIIAEYQFGFFDRQISNKCMSRRLLKIGVLCSCLPGRFLGLQKGFRVQVKDIKFSNIILGTINLLTLWGRQAGTSASLKIMKYKN